MDFITHAAVGALVGRAFGPAEGDDGLVRRRVRWGAMAALVPDVDHVLELVSAEAYLVQHRTYSHSLLLLGLLIVASALPRSWREAKAPRVIAASFASHLLLDLLTPFGTGIGWPFTAAMPALDGLPIFCPWLLIPSLFLALWAARPGRPARAARGVLIGLSCFLLLEAGVAASAREAGTLTLPDWKNPLATHSIEGTSGAFPEELAVAPPLGRFRAPVRVENEAGRLVFEDAQYRIYPVKAPFRITIDRDARTYAVEMPTRGPQLLFWLAVVVVTWLLLRAPPQQEHQEQQERESA